MKNILLQNNEYPIIASPTICKELGLPAAAFFQKLYYLLNAPGKHKRKKNLMQHNNRKWCFHTFEEWTTTLGLFSLSTIKRAVSKLKELGLIEVSKLHSDKSKRINYYTINYKKLKELFGISVSQTKIVVEQKTVTETIIGTDSPIEPEATPEQLATIPSQNRALYRQLRQHKLDIAFDDPRLHFWSNKTNAVIAYTASSSNRLNINRWQWHTPEQVLPEHLIRI